MPRKPNKDDVEALRALLEHYREQTISVGGSTAGKRFDESALVRRAIEALRAMDSVYSKASK